jgi:hypothetical protein
VLLFPNLNQFASVCILSDFVVEEVSRQLGLAIMDDKLCSLMSGARVVTIRGVRGAVAAISCARRALAVADVKSCGPDVPVLTSSW